MSDEHFDEALENEYFDDAPDWLERYEDERDFVDIL
jgi:hypothetical protein